MRLGDVLFKTVEKNEIMSSSEVDEIKGKYKEWLEKKANESKVGAWIKKEQEEWYWRIGLAYFFVWFQRWIYNFMHPEVEEEEEEDDD